MHSDFVLSVCDVLVNVTLSDCAATVGLRWQSSSVQAAYYPSIFTGGAEYQCG